MTTKMTFTDINKIDVSNHVEKKMNLSYLSWAWAHAEMKKIDENAEVVIHEFPDMEEISKLAELGVTITPDIMEGLKLSYKRDSGGAYVKVSVTLNNRTETEYLPVMDMRNKSIVNPTAMDVNKAHKRCFVKALALHGLGLYIYAGEDLPEVDPPKPATPSQRKALTSQIEVLAPHVGKSYEEMEAIIMNKSNVTGRFDNITNEEYGTMLNYVKDLLDFYAKNPDKSKAKKKEVKKEVETSEPEQAGLELTYPDAKKKK